ncbi:hypothetical protein CRG98_034887 [Punica granatum]|uniref:Retrovirus-related Pol polyprotein from transposon TNT 1-94 n=1 Tax=Punica granatum TaxID=22663 RepID=A0A2I0IM24_PUNGR|nr:hypothetical protein CRG98_034887 [Punica granatum]
MEKSHLEMEKFDSRKDFKLWKIKIRDVLIQKGLHKALLGKEKKLKSMEDDEWDEQDEKAVSTIHLCLADEVIFNVKEEKIAASLWTKLKRFYQTKSLNEGRHQSVGYIP